MITPEPYEFDLFGSKTCPHCRTALPACADYFGCDRSKPDGLTCACRACRAAAGRASYAADPVAHYAKVKRYRETHRRGRPAPMAP
jgi:hypothetical protein